MALDEFFGLDEHAALIVDPTLVRLQHLDQRRSRAQGLLPAAPLAHCEAFFPVEPILLRPVHMNAFTLQQEVQPPVGGIVFRKGSAQ